MRARAYFGVYGDRVAIQSVARAANGIESEIKELGTKRPAEHKIAEPSRWIWRTSRKTLDPENLERDLERMVSELVQLPAVWRSAISKAEERSLTLIIQADDDERSTRLALSARTVKELCTLGASFDVDHVSAME